MSRKNHEDLLLRQADERAFRYSFFSRWLKVCMLPIALLTDSVCYISASSAVFNESPITSAMIALTGTACLDIPMSLAGELASRPALKNAAAKRLRIQLAGFVATFLFSYLVYIFLLSYQFSALEGMSALPLLGRCLLPAITSAACFFSSYEANPNGTRAALLERQLLELQAEIHRVNAEVQRGQEALASFDANQFDGLQLELALRQAELAQLEEFQKMRSMMLEVLPTEEAVKAFLINNGLDTSISRLEQQIRSPFAMPAPSSETDASTNQIYPDTVPFRAGA